MIIFTALLGLLILSNREVVDGEFCDLVGDGNFPDLTAHDCADHYIHCSSTVQTKVTCTAGQAYDKATEKCTAMSQLEECYDATTTTATTTTRIIATTTTVVHAPIAAVVPSSVTATNYCGNGLETYQLRTTRKSIPMPCDHAACPTTYTCQPSVVGRIKVCCRAAGLYPQDAGGWPPRPKPLTTNFKPHPAVTATAHVSPHNFSPNKNVPPANAYINNPAHQTMVQQNKPPNPSFKVAHVNPTVVCSNGFKAAMIGPSPLFCNVASTYSNQCPPSSSCIMSPYFGSTVCCIADPQPTIGILLDSVMARTCPQGSVPVLQLGNSDFYHCVVGINSGGYLLSNRQGCPSGSQCFAFNGASTNGICCRAPSYLNSHGTN